MADTPPPVSFAKSIYALSKLVHVDKFRNDTSLKLNEQQRKRLRLLDDIALLLVTESKSDVAVSLERRSTEVHFYYAKNSPTTAADKLLIDELVADLKGLGSPTERIEKMLHKVILVCRAKILSRLYKLKATLLDNQGPYLRRDRNGELHAYFQTNFCAWYAKYPTATEFLTNFLLEIIKPVPSEPGNLFALLRMAHVISSYKPAAHLDAAAAIFIDPMLSRRIRLLGDYYGAVKRIVNHYDFAAKRQSAQIDIIFHPAPVAAQPEIAMPRDYITILNRLATDKNLPTVTYNTLATAYPHRTPGSKHVLQSVHAECTLAVYLASLGRPWTNIEIGCSKSTCWLCAEYLSHKQAGLAFHVRGGHGKLLPGWMMPEGGDKKVEMYLSTLVEDALLEVLHKAHNAEQQPRSASHGEEKKNSDRIEEPFWLRC